MSSRLSVKSSIQPFRKISQKVVRISTAILLFDCVLCHRAYIAPLSGACASLRSDSGPVDDESCNVDVEDELEPILKDNTGTTRDTILFVLHNFLVFLVNRYF